jgi:hypothetical protein
MNDQTNPLNEFSEGLKIHIHNFLELKQEEQQYRISEAGGAQDYYMTAPELAAYLRLNNTTEIYPAVWKHKIPFVPINDIPHFPKKEIDKWILTGACALVLPASIPPCLEFIENDTVIKMRTGTSLPEKENFKGILNGISSGIEINLRLTPENKFRLDDRQLQKIKYDLFLISQNFIDFMDRFLSHYMDGGTANTFEG